MKRIIALVLCIVTALLMASLSVSADSADRVFDPADLLSASEEASLTEHIRALEENKDQGRLELYRSGA